MIIPKGTPYRYQQEVIDFHKSKIRSLSLLDMGLGKSLVALHSMEGFNKLLIICPAFLISNWANEVNKWIQGENGDKINIISYDSLHKLNKEDYEGVILDEVHYIKNRSALRTRNLFHLIEVIKPKKLIGLTGTPIKNRVTDFWTILKLVLPEFNYDYWEFCNRFALKRNKQIGRREIIEFYGINPTNVDELVKIVKSCSIRKKAGEVLDLPKQNYNFLHIPSEIEFDTNLEEEFKEYLKTNNLSKNIASFKLVNAKEKTTYTIKILENILEQTDCVICFTDHIESCNQIADYFKVPPIHGASLIPRENIVEDFNNGKTNILVASIRSLNVGVNLTRASYMVFNDFSYTYSDNEQAEKRIHRIGQNKPCFYTYVFASQLDETIYRIQKNKKITASKVVV